MTKLLIDYDPLLYSAGSVGETRSIHVVHRASGDEYEFANRTAFYGHHKAKAGGYLAEYNLGKSAEKRRRPEDFDITDIQTPEPIANCLHTLKRMIEGAKEAVGAKTHYGYTGKGKTFREDLATVWGYKANRVGMMRPFHLDDMKEYLVKHHACTIITGIEADDACTMDGYRDWQKWKKTKSDNDKTILLFSDKDYRGTVGHIYNISGKEEVSSFDGLGKLWLREDGDVTGRGRMFLYYQVLSSDVADNYAANSASDVKWGSKSAYKLLAGCRTDKEALEAVVKGYKLLYPSPRKIIGWRGYQDPKRTILKENSSEFEIEVDWLYMMKENFALAHMQRWENDRLDVPAILSKLNIGSQ